MLISFLHICFFIVFSLHHLGLFLKILYKTHKIQLCFVPYSCWLKKKITALATYLFKRSDVFYLCIIFLHTREWIPCTWGACSSSDLTLDSVNSQMEGWWFCPFFGKCWWYRSRYCLGSAFLLVLRCWSVLAKLSSGWRSWDVLATS